jgi:hypothetical protein
MKHQSQFIYWVAVATTAFYGLVSIFCFFPYKEFKMVDYAGNSGLQEFMASNPTNKMSDAPEY